MTSIEARTHYKMTRTYAELSGSGVAAHRLSQQVDVDHHRLVRRRPLTVMIEVDFNEYEDAWPWWKPGYHKAHFFGGTFKRVWWLCFAVAWVRLNLYDYNRCIESGRSEWRVPLPSSNMGDQL